MPGRPAWRRRSVSSGVISPRSSAMRRALGRRLFTVLKNSSPGPETHLPWLNFLALGEMEKVLLKPRK